MPIPVLLDEKCKQKKKKNKWRLDKMPNFENSEQTVWLILTENL